MEYSPSFFDSENQEASKLWEVPKSHALASQKPILSGSFFRKGKSNSILAKRNFLLFQDKIAYKKHKDSKKIRAVINFEWARVKFEPVLEEFQDEKGEAIEGLKSIRLVKEQKFTEIMTNDMALYEAWKIELRKMMVNEDFHQAYSVEKMIGKGSFAKVFLAKKNSSNERFAVKAFSKGHLLQKESKCKETLKKEIQILKDLNHPNCIKLYEIHETENSLYLIMELLTGGEIINISRPKQLGKKLRKRIMKSSLEVLVYLESKHIMHRDLKPSNIIFDSKKKKEIKFVDFGLSDYSNSKNFIHKKCGTPGFIAPEVINLRSQSVDYNTSCDVFSLGMVFYCIISGKIAYDGRNFNEVYDNNRNGDVDFEDNDLILNSSDNEIDLLKKMLDMDQNVRITPDEALKHPYFTLEDPKIGDNDNFYSIGLDEFEGGTGSEEHCLKKKIVRYNRKFKFMKDLDSKKKLKIPTVTIDKSLVYNMNPLINGRIDTYVSSKYSSQNSCKIVSLQTGRRSRKSSTKESQFKVKNNICKSSTKESQFKVKNSIYKKALTKKTRAEMSQNGGFRPRKESC